MAEEDFWGKRNRENVKAYEIHFVSFRRVGTDGYNCLSLSKGQKPEAWHIEKLREVIRAYEAGEFDENSEDDYSDLC